MSFSYNVGQIADKMEQEGCAENFLTAVREGSPERACAVLRESIDHIESEGYNDDQAVDIVAALELWITECGP